MAAGRKLRSPYRRQRHRLVLRVLDALNAKLLAKSQCWFGGGTRIALELDEYRESQDVDFLCADVAGYRTLRAEVTERSLGALLPRLPKGVTFLRDVRTDQYGIRTVFSVDGEPVKFEIIREGRIGLGGSAIRELPVPVLDHASCFAEKWLANADRWNDVSVMSRDVVDLAFMLCGWDESDARAGARIAMDAYGSAVTRAANNAMEKFRKEIGYRRRCVEQLGITDTPMLATGLRKLAALTNAIGSE